MSKQYYYPPEHEAMPGTHRRTEEDDDLIFGQPADPSKTIYRELSFCEAEIEFILPYLESAARRCRGNAVRIASSGYGKATTLEKAREWERQSDYIEQFIAKLVEPWS